jgi:serpin B
MCRFKDGKEVTLSVANALCLTTHGSLVHPSYKKLLNTKYSAEIFEAKDVIPINAWVATKTRGKIDKILKNLSANPVCVLLNAVYFKGLWASQFDKKLTRPGSFYTTVDKTLSVSMMHQTARYPMVRHDDFMAVAMPYKVESLAMVIILPDDRTGLAGVEEKLTIKTVQSILKDLEESNPTKVMLSLPRFKIEFGSSLIPAFEALGMKLAFSAEKADFGGITGRDNALGLIWIAQIQHKAFLEVNEEGSEAAAATAVEFQTKSVPSITRFEVDHPFLFMLVDKTTNAILFVGRVNNPLKSN